jgi:hypothetical protein
MTTQPVETSQRQHETVLELLPWHVEGTLSPAEAAMVEQHLQDCEECRTALEEYRYLQIAFAAREDNVAWQPPEGHFEQLLAMIDQAEEETITFTAALAPKKQPPKPSVFERLRAWFAEPARLRGFMVAETLAFAALVLALVIPQMLGKTGESPVFETLTSPAKPVGGACAACLHLVFTDEMRQDEMRNLLLAVRGQIVEGPSQMGVYTVDVGSAESLGAALATLRKNQQVRLAEPIAPPSP